MKPKRNETIRDNRLEKRPDFYVSMGGANPYVTRIRSGDSRQGHLKIVKKITFSGTTTYSGGVTTFTQEIVHNFGKLTYPWGQLKLGGDYFPIPFAGQPGFEVVVTYSHIDKNSLTLSLSSNLPTEELSVEAVVYLLRETM